MRILAIRGANLASLAAPFEVDLTAAPLAGSGLFAITGETGAGKSTILDALCLALYGEYPRVSVGGSEKAPDPSGELTSVKDGRAILRRGAGSGYAEADFTGQDGIGYRVRWQANRARGRANGKLQTEDRSLHRLDDGSAVAAGKTQVREAVEKRTDLTFEQFRRTVLLAQGEFDTFLLASEDDRARLLEKITGTEIYAAISVRVHAGTDARRRSLELAEQRRRDIGLLEDAARQSLAAEHQEIQAAAGLKADERDRVAAQLEQLRRLAEAELARDLALADMDDAVAAHAGGDADRRALAGLDAVEPLRPLSVERSRAESAATAAASAAVTTLADFTTAQGQDATAQEALGKATDTEAQAEAVFKQFGPLWTEAEKLDADIFTAQAETRRTASSAQQTAADAQERARAAADIDIAIAEDTHKHQQAADQLAQHGARALLADRLDEATELLDKHAELREQAAELHKAAQSAAGQVQNLRAQLAGKAAELATGRARQGTLASALADHRSALDAIDEAGLRRRDDALAALLGAVRDAAAVASQHGRSLAASEKSQGDAERAAGLVTSAQAQCADADAARARHSAARDEIAALAGLAQESQSRHAAHLRSLLVPDAPCPVCGSTAHPHLLQPDALGALAVKMAARRAELDGLIQQASQDLHDGKGALATWVARETEALRSIAAARLEIAAAVLAYSGLHGGLADFCAACNFTPPPAALDASSGAVFSAQQALAQSARSALAGPLGQVRHLRAQADDSQRQHDALGPTLSLLAGEIATLTEKQHVIELVQTRETAGSLDLGVRVESVTRELLPFLRAAGLDAEVLVRGAASIRPQLAATAKAHRALRATVQDLDMRLRTLATGRAGAAAAAVAATGAAALATAAHEARRLDLAGRLAQRAGLLEGEATGTHRTRVNDARNAARAALAAARSAQAATLAQVQAARTRHEGAQAAGGAAQDAALIARAAFETACAQAGLADGEVLKLLATDSALRIGLRQRLDLLDQSLREAGTRLATREGDFARLMETGGGAGDATALAQSLASLNAGIDSLHQRSGTLKADLDADDRARLSAAALTTEIMAAKADLGVWQMVDAAIGSASGERFRRFAQAITLDHLVQLANDHLGGLSPRYRLARGSESPLALHIMDRDMGDESRGTRSLSGGERFLVSLALALALSGLEGRESFVDTLFIDEGFGSLDAETLDMAVDALEALHSRGRKVGVVTHVAAMISRIAVQVRVEKRGGGMSVVRIADGLAQG